MEPIPDLPNDVIVEILTWLPVKPLLKLRCVCRSWRSLITSKQFVKSHLEKSKSDRNLSSHRLIMECQGNFKQCSVNSVQCEAVSEAFDLSFSPEMVINRHVDVVGSCNGLVCLLVYGIKTLILWNPSTRIWKRLPDVADIKEQCHSYFDCGFGFDKSSNDYKVVGKFQDINKEYRHKILRVYSLRNDQWKTIKNICVDDDWVWDDPAYPIFANGKMYWVAYPGPEMCWYCYDLEKEEDEIVKIPSYVKYRRAYQGLGAYRRSLLLFLNHETSAKLWIMDEGGTRLVTIPYFDDDFESKKREIVPLYLKDGRILLLGSPTLAIFDEKDCSFRYPEVRDSVEFVARASYIETLVSPLDP